MNVISKRQILAYLVPDNHMGAWRCTVIGFQHQILKTHHVFNTTVDQEYKVNEHLCIIGTKKAKYIWNYSKIIWIWMNTALNPEIGPQ